MTNRLVPAVAALLLFAALSSQAEPPHPLEIIALVDHYDFVGPLDPARRGHFLFDTETPEGCAKILDHVLETGARTILWRPEAGAMMRYHSQEESFLQRIGMDKRRLILNSSPYCWVRYAETKVDVVRDSLRQIRQRGLVCGLHWPFEEIHSRGWTIGAFNLEHPQYWCVNHAGFPWPGRTSLAFPEVMEHKLRIVDEMLAMKPQVLFIDTWRSGGWGPHQEYVEPQVARWRRLHGTEPPAPNDLAWCEHAVEPTMQWYRLLRARLDRMTPRPRLLVGIQPVGKDGSRDQLLRQYGVDWPRLVDEGLVDGLVVMSVNWNRRRPWESTREIYQSIMRRCAGKCQVFFPVQAYHFNHKGLRDYAAATGLTQAEVAARLLQITREAGGAGVVLECVDYRNYPPEVMQVLRDESRR